MPASPSSRPPAYTPVPVRRPEDDLVGQALRFVEQNQLASMVGAFALGVVLGALVRR